MLDSDGHSETVRCRLRRLDGNSFSAVRRISQHGNFGEGRDQFA